MNPPPPEAWPAAPWIFWGALLFIFYTYAGYPALTALVARRRPRPVACRAGHQPTVTAIVAAHNEAAVIRARIDNLLSQDYPPERLDVIAVSDGSTDATASILTAIAAGEPRVRAIVLEENRGKAVALNAAVAAARGELLLFADARQTFARDVTACLAENFADPAVGSASGELILRAAGGVAAQVSLYWQYEKWIRRNESEAGSMLGATGAIYAIRRELWHPLPEGLILDDFLVPMRIVLAGRRAILDGRAIAWDQAASAASREFRRKTRTLAGNFQACALESALLWPLGNPATWFQIWSHKLFRLFVPYALILLFGASLLASGGFYTIVAVGQVVFYAAAAWGWAGERMGRPPRSRAISLATLFTTLNAAAVYGLCHWLQGRSAGQLWRKD